MNIVKTEDCCEWLAPNRLGESVASSVSAIINGFDYQAFWFWFYVVQMFGPDAEVESVGFEVSEYTSFDDVAVRYKTPVPDGEGGTISGKFFSIKLSVTYGKEISVSVLDDPALINASSVSLLQRLKEAVEKMEKHGVQHLFVLVAPWGLKSGDEIQKLVSTSNGSLRLNTLFDGAGPRGAMGKLRKRWTKHLGLKDESELRPILSRLRFDLQTQTQDKHIEQLSPMLTGVGIQRILKNDLAAKHFRLPYALHRLGKNWHTQTDLFEVCKSQELLIIGDATRDAVQLGIRSFKHKTEELGSEVDHLLCVIDEFDDRLPKSAITWTDAVPGRLQEFLSEVVHSAKQYDLHLHCFGSLAFFIGYLMEPGSEVSPAIVQRTYGKPAELWIVDAETVRTAVDPWTINIEEIGDGPETAIAASISNSTIQRVKEYCLKTLPNVGRVVHASPKTGIGQTAITSGNDAFVFASHLKNHLSGLADRSGPLHLFWSAPNAFAFYFGQLARMLGKCLVHEFNPNTQTYSPGIEVSPNIKLMVKEKI